MGAGSGPAEHAARKNFGTAARGLAAPGNLQSLQVERLALPVPGACEPRVHRIGPRLVALRQECLAQPEKDPTVVRRLPQRTPEGLFGQIGRASGRERGGKYV